MSLTTENTQESQKSDRFIIKLNPVLGIEQFQAQKFTRPEWNSSTGWSPIEIEFVELLGHPNSSKIVELISRSNSEPIQFDFNVDMFDAIGKTNLSMDVKGELLSLQHSQLSYDNSDICTFKITVQPKEVNLSAS